MVIEGVEALLLELGPIKDTHDDGAGSVSALVLGKVVAARKLLATVAALKGLITGVERAVVALKMFLATETAVAKSAHKRLGRILGQRLLAATAAGWCHWSFLVGIGA